ncbi:MAG: FecR domain-containing protein [Pseudomonadota bacterium]
MTSRDPERLDALAKDALSLLLATAELPEDERASILDDWAAQSAEHDDALAHASDEWGLFGSLPDDRMSFRDRIGLAADIALTQATDHPARVATVACAALALLILPMGFSLMPPAARQDPAAGEPATWDHTDDFTHQMTRYITGQHEQREIELPDGSRLWLNWNSEVIVADLDDEVHVDVIIGDALFAPSTQRDKALVVHAGQAFTYNPTTEFAVHTHGTRYAAFAVKKGVLSLKSRTSDLPIHIAANQRVNVSNGEGGLIEAVSARSIGDWREEKIVLVERPLVDALYSLAHYTEKPLRVGLIDDPQRRVTATFSMRNAEDALMQLASTYDLELDPQSPDALEIRSVVKSAP